MRENSKKLSKNRNDVENRKRNTSKISTKKIALEVSRILLPHIKKIILEQNKVMVAKNRRIIREEIEVLYDDDTVSVPENIVEAKKNIAKRVNSNSSFSSESAKRKANSIVGSMDLYGNDINSLIAETEIPADEIEGGDTTYKPAQLVPAEKANSDLSDVDPANIDFGAFVENE